ncbi:Telomeric repeat-binding factor 2 [compost metagenome]
MKTWKQAVTSVTLSVALLTMSAPVWAADVNASQTNTNRIQSVDTYALTQSVHIEIKSLLNEPTGDGTRLGVVLRVSNTSNQLTRVPEYELRIRTVEGVEYKLKGSAKNPASIQPKSQLELSYLTIIDQPDELQLDSLQWVEVDEYVYPKKETIMLNVPIDSIASWKGSDTVITDQLALKKWGEVFSLSVFRSPIEYRTTDIHKEVDKNGPVTVVQIEAANPSNERQTVPEFTLDGTTGNLVFNGVKAEGSITLEPKEKKYLHILIPTDLDSELTALNVVTPEKFSSSTDENTFYVGRLRILLPSLDKEEKSIVPTYELGKPMELDPLNKRVHSSMEVALVELNMNEIDEDGFKTAIAKFKYTNKSDRPLPIPNFQTSLASKDGYEYNGSKQATVAQKVVPNAAYTVSYSYAIPSSEQGKDLKISLYDQQVVDQISFLSPLAAYKVNAEPSIDNKKFKVYPYDINLKDWAVSANYSNGTYSYKVKVYLDILQDKQVITDATGSKLEFAAYDNLGRVLGSSTQNLVGQNRLYNGANTISLNAESEQLEYPLTIKVYEVFTNANGELVKRFLTSFKN